MDETYSLMEFLQGLVSDTELRDWFTQDPQAALHSCGLDHLSPADVHDARVLVEDNQTADFSRDYDTGSGGFHLPPPPADHDFASPAQAHHAAVSYLNDYVTSNHVDHGGGFDHWIDVDSTAASGDVAGSTIPTGDHTAFGSGNATSTGVHGDVGDGAAFASGGSATVDDSHHSPHDVRSTWTDHSANDSFTDSGDHGDQDPFDDESSDHGAIDNGQHHAGDVDLH